MRNDLQKDFQKYPRGISDLFFSLTDWIDSFGLKKVRSRNRDGSPGNTVRYILNNRQFCSVQISPAGDLHFGFSREVIESYKLLSEFQTILYSDIQPHIIGDKKGVGNEETNTGLKIILTESDVSIAELITRRLAPVFEEILNRQN